MLAWRCKVQNERALRSALAPQPRATHAYSFVARSALAQHGPFIGDNVLLRQLVFFVIPTDRGADVFLRGGRQCFDALVSFQKQEDAAYLGQQSFDPAIAGSR